MADAGDLQGLGETQAALLRLLLRNKEGLTVDAIAEGLSITRTAVNQHLTALERNGHVARRDFVATGGRPGRVFAISERGVALFPKKYDLVSLKMLETMIESLGPLKARRQLDRIGAELGAEVGETLSRKSLAQRAPAITDLMQSFGFDAELEKEGREPVIRAYNCVYHALAKSHPDVCAIDLALLREASGADVEHLACMATGANACRFKFSGKK